nr:hypothetical protein [Methylobacterium sp. Leaf122]
MLRYTIGPISAASSAGLSGQQALVDAETSHEKRYNKAKSLFGRKVPKKTFDEIKSVLAAHSPSGSACYYCERDRYRDIEHIWPKRHYPNKCFEWENYVYACTICNQDAKRDKFAVFDVNDNVIEFDRSLPIDQPVPTGDPVQINIRVEDPLEYLQMDLQTGRFVTVGQDKRANARGIYTRDLFDLDNDVLTRIRRQAVYHFTDYITRYCAAKNEGRADDAARLLSEILELPFPTVLVELRRQKSISIELEKLIDELPPHIGARP